MVKTFQNISINCDIIVIFLLAIFLYILQDIFIIPFQKLRPIVSKNEDSKINNNLQRYMNNEQ